MTGPPAGAAEFGKSLFDGLEGMLGLDGGCIVFGRCGVDLAGSL